ncbi:amino acid ABC transporter substrate-binding protein, PAAT family [Magnetococcus marinus MC-1]|uniref:Amino acid ABC transporter substrate-binding protein, PAAT family n=1 Tax=Magnetococcus marinus (strain ATCC BAA-1437 / JCM 17883 / MC-1) TaxID=156889 RepID=A0L4Q9_MAGMM|nr:transporter substrate-binding domain-containing protein [Magnetococcus marinus]ABK42952.1 amino acid ABC transporter substrate-binding protein, PAAT family [Magnetococcus marinus MC-1]
MRLALGYLLSFFYAVALFSSAQAHDILQIPMDSPFYDFCAGMDAFQHLDGDHSALTEHHPAPCLCGEKWHTLKASLRLNTTSSNPLSNDSFTGFQDLLTLEAFCRQNLRISLTHLAGKPSLHMANRGVDDGTVGRIASLLEDAHLSNLVAVPESIMAWDFSAFTRTPSMQPHSWAELAPYHVAYNRGWIILDHAIRTTKSTVRTQDSVQLLTLLAKNRVDVVVVEKWQGLAAASQIGMQPLYLVNPPLASQPMYLFLHRNHRDLVKPLAATLQQMKQDGTYQAIFAHTLQPLIAPIVTP